MRLQGRCGHLKRVKTASAAAVVLALGSAPAPASAEGLFSWLFGGQQRFQASPSAPMRAMRYRAAHKSSTHNAQTAIDTDTPTSSTSASKSNGTKADKAEAVETHGPLFVVVSLNDEHIRVYDDHGLVTSSIVSTGVEGHPTPKGVFTILGRERFHASNLYSGAPMPYMQRVTWSGVAMHVGVVTGHPASHGCIRLPVAFAQKIWGLTKIGERVVISPSDISPEGFSSSQLPVAKMYPRAEEAAPAAAIPAAPPATEAKATPAADTTTTASTDAVPGEAAKPAVTAPAPVVQASAEARPPLNPKEWAVRMKAKAVADKAAAVKAAQQAQAALAAQAAESARLADAARVAEANLTLARAKSDTAERAFEAAEAALAARHRDATVAMDEPTKSEADPLGGAKTAVLAKALESAVAAKDFAAQAKTKAESEVELASVAVDQAHAAR